MPKYFVALNRPEVDAATPEEAMTKCLSEPVGPNDTFYVKEVVPAESSTFYVAGAVATLGGGFLNPDATATCTTMRKE